MTNQIIRVGFVPYLNMVPFHKRFGPAPLTVGDYRFEFHSVSPHALGLEADDNKVDVGAMSLVDLIRCGAEYEPLGSFGIGVKRAAQSVLLFSQRPVDKLGGATVAVTDQTSTSSQLLRVLFEQRYELKDVRYGRVASLLTFDGDADAILLIGDEALEARVKGIRKFNFVTDLGESWFEWQKVPFVFARWAVKSHLPKEIKTLIETQLENSLTAAEKNIERYSLDQASERGVSATEISRYWQGFDYRLTPPHLESIRRFNLYLAPHATII